MQFTEMGNQAGKTLLLLPGTACTWQLNFKHVVDELAERYHIIAVNYDGFEGDPGVIFTDVPTVTEKIEDYILEHHGGRVDGAYGSSLGGSFVGLLIERQRIHIDHGFIGSSDLDQGGTRIFKEWLPGNPEYELCGNANVEWYDCVNGEKTDPDYHSAIWVPVRRKG